MAEKLLKYYNLIDKEMGLQGRMRLAQATKLPTSKAALEPDTPANVKMFKEAYEQITGRKAPEF